MGSFNTLCAVSKHVVNIGDKVKLIPFNSSGSCVCPVVIDAIYNDYGNFVQDKSKNSSEDIKSWASTLAVLDSTVTEQNVMDVTSSSSIKQKSKYDDTYIHIGFVVVLSDVYDYLIAESKKHYAKSNPDLSTRNNKDVLKLFSSEINSTVEERVDKCIKMIEYLKNEEDNYKVIMESYQNDINKIRAGAGCTDAVSAITKSQLIDSSFLSAYTVGSTFSDIDKLIDLEYFLIFTTYVLDINLELKEPAKQDENNFQKMAVFTAIQRIAYNQTSEYFKLKNPGAHELVITQYGIDELVNSEYDENYLQKKGNTYITIEDEDGFSAIEDYLKYDIIITDSNVQSTAYTPKETVYVIGEYKHVFGEDELNNSTYYKKYDSSGKVVEMDTSYGFSFEYINGVYTTNPK